MPVQWKLKWKSAFWRLTAEQFSGTNIHNILCFSAYATNRFLVHPSIHHKTNEHRSSQKNTYSFQPRILTDKFIVKKHHCVQIWNFLLVVHLQKLMIHRYSLNSTEPPWLRNTTHKQSPIIPMFVHYLVYPYLSLVYGMVSAGRGSPAGGNRVTKALRCRRIITALRPVLSLAPTWSKQTAVE